MWAHSPWIYVSTKEPADSPGRPPWRRAGPPPPFCARSPQPLPPPPPAPRPRPASGARPDVAAAPRASPAAPAACIAYSSRVRAHQRCRHLAVPAPWPRCRAGGKTAAGGSRAGPVTPGGPGGWPCPSPGRGAWTCTSRTCGELKERVLPLLQASPTMGLNITNKARPASKAWCRPVRARGFQEAELACGLDRANKMTCCCTSGRSRRPYRLLTSV